MTAVPMTRKSGRGKVEMRGLDILCRMNKGRMDY